jgi:hypothetical protein
MSEDSGQEGLHEYASMIREQRYQLENDLARYLFSLGGGSAILSVTLFSVLPKPLYRPGFLVVSWICSAITLIGVFLSIRFSINSRHRAYELAHTVNPDFSELDRRNIPIKICDDLAFGSGILALILLGFFAASNIGDAHGKSEQEKWKSDTCQEEREQHSITERAIGSNKEQRSQANTGNRLRPDQNP